MALMRCETCGKEISTNALACPHCGEETALSREKRRKKKRIVIGVVIAFICIHVAVLFVIIGLPRIRDRKRQKKLENKYVEAMQLASDGEFEKAREIFLSLGDYNDCVEQVKQCDEGIKNQLYDKGLRFQLEGNFEEADVIFESLSDYKDSEALLKEVRYERGMRLQAEGIYEEAADVFKNLGEYKDSKEQRDSCWTMIADTKYQEALQLYKNKQYDKAYELFAELDGYKDSNDMMTRSLFAKIEVGQTISFGAYEQDGDISNGSEPIEWIVLSKESEKILLFSKYILDWKPFNNSKYDRNITWATSSLREWLNGSFYQKAFGPEIQRFVLDSEVNAVMNPQYTKTEQGRSTVDKVFLLSAYKVSRHFADFLNVKESKKSDWKNRFELLRKKLDIPSEIDANSASQGWWTSTIGYNPGFISFVTDVSIDYRGQYVWWSNNEYPEYLGVRPAIYISYERFSNIDAIE